MADAQPPLVPGDLAERHVVLSTAPNRAVAERLARQLVGDGLAACVNLLPGARSIYRWRGELHADDETLMLIKTTADRLDEMTAAIVDGHPYDCPEVVVLDIAGGSAAYLDWITRSVGAEA